MTQGIISIRKDRQMLYKIVVGHDGMNALKVARRVRSLDHLPAIEELKSICAEEDFGCPNCLIILEHDDHHWSAPIFHCGPEIAWEDGSEDYNRYRDTFRVAQFNPRWKYGTADYVEVIDL